MMEYSTADALAPLAVWLNNQFLRLCKRTHKRKNYLFAGSKAGGERAAVLYTILGTAKLNDWTSQILQDTFNSYNVTYSRGVYEQRQTIYQRLEKTKNENSPISNRARLIFATNI